MDEFEQVLFSCCESNLHQYSLIERYDFYQGLLTQKSDLIDLYRLLKNNDIHAKHFESILEKAKHALVIHFRMKVNNRLSNIEPMVNHTIYGLARRALSVAYQ